MSNRKRVRPRGTNGSPSKRRRGNAKEASPGREGQVHLQIAEYQDEQQRNWFGYTWASLVMRAVTEQKNKTSLFKECDDRITAKLVFENGEPVPDDIVLETSPPLGELALAGGECAVKLQVNTLSMYHENRLFKVVFSGTGGRHVRPCETHAFRLVKHRLEVVTQPGERFYKDEGGRSNCLNCLVHLKDGMGNVETKRNQIPLQLKLVYGDNSPAQSQRDILEILTQNVEIRNGECRIDFRINEVSKNHNKRAFRLFIECAGNNPLYGDISSVTTRPIMVYSKRTKKNKQQALRRAAGHRPTLQASPGSSQHSGSPAHFVPPAMMSLLPSSVKAGALPGAPQNLPFSAMVKHQNGGQLPIKQEEADTGAPKGIFHTMMDWCQLAEWVLKILEWVHCGYELDPATNMIDPNRPLYRCCYCLRYRNCAGFGQHEENCQLQLALEQYNRKVKAVNNEFQFNSHTAQSGAMAQLEAQNASPIPVHSNGSHAARVAPVQQQAQHQAQQMHQQQQMARNMGMMAGAAAGAHPMMSMQGYAAQQQHLMRMMQTQGLFPVGMNPAAATGNPMDAATAYGFIAQAQQGQAPAQGMANQHQQEFKQDEKVEGRQGSNGKHRVELPFVLNKVTSVSKERTDLGWAALDDEKNLLGFFDDTGGFMQVQSGLDLGTADLFGDDLLTRDDTGPKFLENVRDMIMRHS